ncbi:MAG: LamG-like jellyroll fold domain-containing protein, partial [Gammaproteobacteria bacterium]
MSDFSNEVSATITSAGAPTANFSANPTSGVAPLTVTFADTSTGTISTRSWDFGDHSPTSAATSGAKTYSTPGIYTMSLSVTGPNGSSTATKTISATAAAVADFTANPTSGTAPLDVTFTNRSTGNIISYSWDFGDGGSSTAQNPSHTFSSNGTYTVNLTATSLGGTNTKPRTGYITVSSVTGGGGTGGSTTGLVAAYNFEEASGTTVVDASGKGNHGTISGASRITSGRFGRGLSFDGVNDWVTVNDTASLDLTTGMTLEAWVYPTVFPSDWRTILHKETDRYYLMAGSDLDTPAAGGTYTSGNQNVYAGSSLPVNTWTHLAVTYASNSASVKLHINADLVATKAQTVPLTTSTGAMRIAGTQAYGEFFQGRIDEIRVYNRALSAAEIDTDMNKAVTASCLQTALNVSAASSDGGFAYKIVKSFGTPADNTNFPTRSTLRLFENSLELGPAHSGHGYIRNLGQGRFSHWITANDIEEALRFSASDNTDPRTNGRSYTYCVPGPAPDTTPPTVSLTAPAEGATVSGIAVTVSATAFDTMGVAGVQFRLDDADLGTEDTTAPYAVTWDSTTAANGSHTLTALARDAAGNTTTSAGVSVTVNNAPNAPPVASNVVITGTAQVGQVLTGSYDYADAENDPQGASTFRWLRGTTPIT